MVKITINIDFDFMKNCFIQPDSYKSATIAGKFAQHDSYKTYLDDDTESLSSLSTNGPEHLLKSSNFYQSDVCSNSYFSDRKSLEEYRNSNGQEPSISNKYAITKEANASRRENLDKDLAGISFRRTRHYFYKKKPD